jgi:hypothetical protein
MVIPYIGSIKAQKNSWDILDEFVNVGIGKTQEALISNSLLVITTYLVSYAFYFPIAFHTQIYYQGTNFGCQSWL